MVTVKTLERYLNNPDDLAKKAGVSEKAVRKLVKVMSMDIMDRRRQPPVQPPDGSISIRAAARKYDIPCENISRWVRKGLIPLLLKTKNEHFIEEKAIIPIADKYKQSHGRGKREIFNELKRNDTPLIS